MTQNQNLDIHGSIDLFRQDWSGKCIKIKNGIFMGQSICFVKTSTENTSKSKFGYSWVNRFVSSRLVRKKLQNQNLDIQGSIDLFRQDWYGKCIKIKIWIFIGQSICLVKTSTENASKSKFGYSWVNRFVSSRLVRN